MVTLTTPWDEVSPSGCSILIVDDSEVDRATYRHYLESSKGLGCNILECESAEGALELCNSACPDVILLDYLLPDVNGLELLHDLTQQLETLPSIIMLTGQGSEAVAVESMKQGAIDYLIKGQLTSQKLISSVTHALTERKLHLQLERQQQQRELLTSVALNISHSVELPHILQTAVEGVREILGCDRALVYRLNHEMSGTIVAESVLPAWPAIIGRQIENKDLQQEQASQIETYLQGHPLAITNIDASVHLTASRLQILKQLQVKSVLTIPIIFREVLPSSEPTLWGLLIAHHCQTLHEWQPDELSLLDGLSTQMAIAIQQAELVSNLKVTLEHQKNIKHQLQDRVIEVEQTNLYLSQTTRLLEKRNQELYELSYIVSHDLQTPLRGIGNLAEWLIEDLNDQLPLENKRQLELIQSRVLQMNRLIRGLLEYAKVGKENIDFMPVNISQLLAEVVDFLMPPNEFKIQFTADLPTIETQALLLKQVLCNLLDNAIKYHDQVNGKVEILVENRESLLQFTIIDDGPGIAEENHEKIFDIFKTLAKHDDKKGTGIGLAIVKKIVEGQGGSFWVESELGKGSSFSFTWPKAL